MLPHAILRRNFVDATPCYYQTLFRWCYPMLLWDAISLMLPHAILRRNFVDATPCYYQTQFRWCYPILFSYANSLVLTPCLWLMLTILFRWHATYSISLPCYLLCFAAMLPILLRCHATHYISLPCYLFYFAAMLPILFRCHATYYVSLPCYPFYFAAMLPILFRCHATHSISLPCYPFYLAAMLTILLRYSYYFATHTSSLPMLFRCYASLDNLHSFLYAFQYTMSPLKETVPSYLSRFWGCSSWANFGIAMRCFWYVLGMRWAAVYTQWPTFGTRCAVFGQQWPPFGTTRLRSSQDKYGFFLHIWIVHWHTYLLILSMYWPQG
jgi:hypothetical protein